MTSSRTLLFVALTAAAAIASAPALAKDKFKAELDGYQETAFTLSVAGSGEFRVDINKAKTELEFELIYEGLTGSASAAHIHLGRPGLSGGVIVFLCGGGGKPACPAGTGGTVEGTITAADVLGPTTQGIAAGEFAALLRAMEEGATYANVHTAAFPSGEIRGAIK
jgi:hypothetical protein